MGTGKKLARAEAEMSTLKMGVVKELKQSMEREKALVGHIRRLERLSGVRLALALLALLCWVLTYFLAP